MSFNVKTISVFERQAKRLMKKFPSLKKEIQTPISELKEEPTKVTSIGHDCHKINASYPPDLFFSSPVNSTMKIWGVFPSSNQGLTQVLKKSAIDKIRLPELPVIKAIFFMKNKQIP